MKYTSKALALAALVALCSCTNDNFEETNPKPDQTVPVSILAEMPAPRASIEIGDGHFTGQWESGLDKIGVHATLSGNTPQANIPFTFSEEGYFQGALTPGTGAWNYLAYYPHTESAMSETSVAVPFGNTRTQTGGKFNSQFDALVGSPQSTVNSSEGKDDQGNPIQFPMHRLTSILDFDLTGASTDPIQYVLLTATNEDQVLSAKSLNFDVADGHLASPVLDAAEQSKSILLQFEEGSASAASRLDAFFNILPGNYSLQLDLITTTGQIASTIVDRTDAGNPFVAGTLYTKQTGALTFAPISTPSLNWPDQAIDAVHEITVTGSTPFEDLTLTYPAAIDITVPGAIAGLTVDIDSKALNSIGITTLDLVNETSIMGSIPYAQLGLKCGTEIQYAKSTVFDITKLVPMITMLDGATGDHIFKVTVTDLAGQQTVQELKFHYGLVEVTATDLWKNTATLTITPQNTASEVTLEYKRSTETNWQKATVSSGENGTFIASIEPSWIDTTNEDGIAAQTLDATTGIFAGATYDYRLSIDGTEAEVGQFTTSAGNTLPDGSLETTWKSDQEFNGTSGNVISQPWLYDFWGSGYNSFAAELCTRDATMPGRDGQYCAKLTASYNSIANIPAPGNLFTGDFKTSMSPMGGYVSFGKSYEYNARPSAIKVKVHATIKNVDYNLYGGPIEVGQPDKGRIMVCIVDWNAQHQVFAGKSEPQNAWDPNKDKTVAEGPIIGYASKFITSTVGDSMEEITIPICYNENTATPPTGPFNIVISCTTSAYGDYMNASTENVLYIDDFQWVY